MTKRTSDRPRPSRKTSVTGKEGSPSKIISELFHTTTEFWLLVLCEQSWPFSFYPAPLKINKSQDNPEQSSTATAPPGKKTRLYRTKETPLTETTDSPEKLKPNDASDDPNFWDEVRAQLVEERDQLCLWKIGFADRDIDGLLNSESDIHRQLGKIILEILLGSAVSMSTAVDLQKASEGTRTGKDEALLKDSAEKLDKLIKEATKITSSNPREQKSESDENTSKLATPTQLIANLRSNTAKLSKLSLQITLVTTQQKGSRG
ncbi:hypothetical protein F5Y12DRAFT_717884 [Xylaria sp. FL1777]|nr:hypothetical protein F5Y12DRAFT_717884 [Xylaria sp. FL1777]